MALTNADLCAALRGLPTSGALTATWITADRIEAQEKEIERLQAKLDYLIDLPACRQQLPDGTVPGNTEEALRAWMRIARGAMCRRQNVNTTRGEIMTQAELVQAAKECLVKAFTGSDIQAHVVQAAVSIVLTLCSEKA